MLEMFSIIPELTVYGNSDPEEVNLRVPTFSINMQGMPPRKLAEELDKKNIYAWDGHYYAINVVQKLGLTESGGMVRIGAAHYNTLEEVELLGKALKEIVENIQE